MKEKILNHRIPIGCFLLLLSALFYLSMEAVCVASSTSGFSSYLTHTISDLGVPYSITGFSKNYILMKTAFLVVGPCYVVGYWLIFAHRLSRMRPLCLMYSFTLCIGVSMVGLFHCESGFLFFHFFGTVLCFASGNMLNILTGLSLPETTMSYKLVGILLGAMGMGSAILMIFFPDKNFTPLLERFTILPVLLFEIATSVYFFVEYYKTKKQNAWIKKKAKSI